MFYELLVDARRPFIEYTKSGDYNDWASIVCPIVSGHQRAGRRITPLFVDIQSERPTDFSRTMLSDIVIADHALSVLRRHQLTGFTVAPVKIVSTPRRGKDVEVPGLWELLVTGNGGNAHPDSGVVKLWECNGCGQVRYSAYKHGLQVDVATYDGSDFFTVAEYPKHVLVNARTKAVIEEHHLTNATFIESSHLQWPASLAEPT